MSELTAANPNITPAIREHLKAQLDVAAAAAEQLWVEYQQIERDTLPAIKRLDEARAKWCDQYTRASTFRKLLEAA